MAITVRPARPGDAAAELLYTSAAAYYDAYAGSSRSARALLSWLYPQDGHSASYDVCLVAEEDGHTVGVVSSFAAAEASRYARRFVSLSVRRLSIAAWPGTVRHLRAAARVSPAPPAGAWYVDGLAVSADHRRRGVARVLLEAAEEEARGARAAMLALDTGLENAPAQALYTGLGFSERSRSLAPDEPTAEALGGSGFVSYAKLL